MEKEIDSERDGEREIGRYRQREIERERPCLT
jgi:hypothetical protein